MADSGDIDITVTSSGTGCLECEQTGGWWPHLRRCAACGHVGCCDNSPYQHGTKHAATTGHRFIQSYEPGEDWFYDFETGEFARGPQLAAPTSHPESQPVPGPAGRVPARWREQLNT